MTEPRVILEKMIGSVVDGEGSDLFRATLDCQHGELCNRRYGAVQYCAPGRTSEVV